MIFEHLPHKFKLNLAKISAYSYRNYFSSPEHINLLDDLNLDEDEEDILAGLVNMSGGIDQSEHQIRRPIQYGEAYKEVFRMFGEGTWNQGRYGNGQTFGVWYGALDEDTSIHETLYHLYLLAKSNSINAKKGNIIFFRKMIKVLIESNHLVDLTKDISPQTLLTHSSDLTMTQSLGEFATKNNVEAFLAPSARKIEGVCTPIFNASIFKDFDMQKAFLYNLKFSFNHSKLNKPDIEKLSQKKLEAIEIPESWD